MAEGTPGPETRPPQPAAGALSLPELGLLAFLLYPKFRTAVPNWAYPPRVGPIFSIPDF